MHLCSGPPPSKEETLPLVTDSREVERQLKRRQKNRVAAQRSRQKHTDKADELHQEHEWLEKDNRALRKEIWSLQAEVKRWLQALEEHQRVCLMAGIPTSAWTPPDHWSQTEPAPQTPLAGQQAPLGSQSFPALLKAPASPSAQPPSPAPPHLFSACSLSSPVVSFLVTAPTPGSPTGTALAQIHGISSLPAPPQQSASPSLREGKTEESLSGSSVTPPSRGALP
ncbi:basic leucine zipper transcriptional factor ATF-like 2 [Macrotis lagotis]|uniref:basic leucine zipper transcriptional factor ATF-like 2 n=1 Tax=Macrotis lagotis TaxID=92651 RepID=UPI003D68714F